MSGAARRPDVLVVGGGHNGLVAAILAASAGRRVTLVERAARPGGATVGEVLFDGHPVRLSRYAYLVSLFPDELVRRLGIDLPLAPRTVASWTPVTRAGRATGLLVEREPGVATAASFRAVTGSDEDHRAWQQLYSELAGFARAVAPVLSGPLRTRSEVRDAVTAQAGARIWDDVVEQPIGEMITRRFRDDTVRGVVATDALIGTSTSLFDPARLANRCFLYHLVGRGTGEWSVPVGGMGAVSDALLSRARALGVVVHTGTEVTGLDEGSAAVTVLAEGPDGRPVEYTAAHVLAAVAPAVVDGWRGRPVEAPTGAQLKVNMLLSRLPRLAAGVDPAMAFAGTVHLREGFDELEAAYARTAAGELPDVLPAEVYCHSLTDPSILNGAGGATLTLFGLHSPVELFRADPVGTRERATRAALAALQQSLAEPLEDCLAHTPDGRPCLDVSSPVDLEHTLGMPGGNIFHGDLSWPWRADDDGAAAAGGAAAWGVTVDGARRVLQAGAGSTRGGGVSGLGGAAAVDALLASSEGR